MKIGKFLILLFGLLTQRSLAENYRLTKFIIPDLYDIHIKPYLSVEDGQKLFTFEGKVNITLYPTVRRLSQITLHVDRLNISVVALFNSYGQVIQKVNQKFIKYEPEINKMTFLLWEHLLINETYILYVKYRGNIRSDSKGFYKAYDSTNWYVLTHLNNIEARTVFPCFDEPEFKAKFRMHINRPKGYNSYFNTRLQKTTNDGIDRFIDHFEETPLMSTYLLAFVVTTFNDYGSTDLRIIIHPKFYDKIYYAHEVGIQLMKAFDNYTQMPYKTLGNNIMQNFGTNYIYYGSMENWGLAIYEDSILVQEPGYTDDWRNKQYTVNYVAHTTTHMWFGNSITPKWWSYIWLCEALPSYYQYFLAQEVYPEFEFDKQFLINEMYLAFDIDATIETLPMTSPEDSVYTPKDIEKQFGNVPYAKGATIIRMFANLMGKRNFDAAIRKYLKKNYLKTTTPDDLFECLKEFWPSGHLLDLDEFFKDWTEKAGYPIVIVSIFPTGKFYIRQQRFLLDIGDKNELNREYIIPITYNNHILNDFNNLEPKFYLTKNEDGRFVSNTNLHKWIIINTQQSNYYRVFYDIELLKEIRIALMETNHSGIHVNNRAGIVNDLFTYGRNKIQNYDIIFNFLEYLSTETEYLPWKAAFNGLDFIYKRLTVAQHDKLGDYLSELLQKVYLKLGFENTNVSILDIYNRNNVINWLCRSYHEDCNINAQRIFHLHLSAGTKPSPDFREVLYCAANRYDNSNIYINLQSMFIQQNLTSEKEKILRAMGCTSYHVKDHYEFLLSNNVSLELKTLGLKSLYNQTPKNIVPVFHLMINNFEQLKKALTKWSTTAYVIKDIADYLTTTEELAELKQFIIGKENLFGPDFNILKMAKELAENNFIREGDHFEKLMDYLSTRNVTYRLNKDVIPKFYDIYIKPYLKSSDGPLLFYFDGEVNIELEVMRKNIRKITLHKDDINILKTTLYDSNGNVVEIMNSGSILYEPLTHKLTICLSKPLNPNMKYILYFKYIAKINDEQHGFFRASYDNKTWYGVTQLQRTNARMVFPCFDEPEFKAKFRIRINRPSEYKAFSNTRIVDSTQGHDYCIDNFEETPPMSTYLVALLISDYESIKYKDIQIVMHRKFKNKTNFAVDVSLKLLKAFEDFTLIPYKSLGNTYMQMTTSPQFPYDGMENWGLIIYKESILALEPNSTDDWFNKQNAIATLAHEISHMWFGNSVTFKWWNSFWLNEGFARYFQYFVAHEVYPEFELDKLFVVHEMQSIFIIDATNNTQPLTSPEESINSPIDIDYKFNDITYSKGAVIVRMFINAMGKGAFNKAIREYLQDHHLKNVVPEDLFYYLKKYWDKRHNIDMDQFFKSWTEQVGYPMVKISKLSDYKYSLTQQRFLIDPEDGSDTSLRYTIPITYSNNRFNDFSDLRPRFYFNQTEKKMTMHTSFSDKWIILNSQQSNYYRVFYDSSLLSQLFAAFNATNHSGIDVRNRASIVDDLLTFGASGLRGYDEIFQFLEYLTNETEYLPWLATFNGIETLYQRLPLDKHKDFGKLLHRLLDKVYKKLGFFENPNDTIMDTYLRIKVIDWLCRYKHEDCNTNAQQIFYKYLNNNTKPATGLREVLYCAAVRSDKDLHYIYSLLLRMYTLQQDPYQEKEKQLRSMSCIRYRIEEHYSFILSEDISQHLKSTALEILYSKTPENVDRVFELMTNNFSKLTEAFGDQIFAANIISDISKYLTTQEQLNRLLIFIRNEDNLSQTTINILHNSIGSIRKNFEWAKTHLEKLYSYLNQRNGVASNVAVVLLVPLLLIILKMCM